MTIRQLQTDTELLIKSQGMKAKNNPVTHVTIKHRTKETFLNINSQGIGKRFIREPCDYRATTRGSRTRKKLSIHVGT